MELIIDYEYNPFSGGFTSKQNSLSGTLPDSLSNCTHLSTLAAFNNSFTGTIPAAVNWPSMVALDLHGNFFTSTLPNAFGIMSQMQYFDASDNNLSGALPTTISSWSSIKQFSVSSNRLSSTLPAEIGQWNGEVLELFDVSDNLLNSTIPESTLSWQAGVGEANFQNNDFTGSVPDGFCELAGSVRVDCGEVECYCCGCT